MSPCETTYQKSVKCPPSLGVSEAVNYIQIYSKPATSDNNYTGWGFEVRKGVFRVISQSVGHFLDYLGTSIFKQTIKSLHPPKFFSLVLFNDHFYRNIYSCGLSTATIEYSSACVCVSVSVCVSVCLCVCKHDNSKNNSSRNLKFE